MKVLEKIVKWLETWISVITFSVMLVLAFANVVSRFALHLSLSFTEEIVTTLFVLASFAGTAVAVERATHLGLDFVVGFMPVRVQQVLAIVGNILGLFFCIILLYYGYGMVMQEFSSHQLSPTMQWPAWIYGLTVPVGSALLTLRYIVDTYHRVIELGQRDSAQKDKAAGNDGTENDAVKEET